VRRGLVVLCLVALVFCAVSCKIDGKPADLVWSEKVAAHRNTIDMEQYTMQYIVLGKGEPVMLIHGFSDSSYCWHNNVDALLEAGFQLILVDQPGMGQSTIPPKDFPLTAENLGKQIIKLADHLKLGTFSVIGSSLGGGVSLYLCLEQGDRIKRAIVMDPAAFPQKKTGLLSLMDLHGAHLIMGRWSVKQALVEVYHKDELVSETLVDEYARPFAKEGYGRFLVRLLSEYSSPESAQMSTRYPEIETPLLILWGEKDVWIEPKNGPRLNALVEGSKLVVIENAGHIPSQERPEIVNPVMVEFLKGE
jgi:2-hydroxy-6-oxonona-2,4-dienedioate hydrolase